MNLIASIAKRLGGIKAIYDGATVSTRRSMLPGTVRSARFDILKLTRWELVRKARYFEKNDAFVNRMADLFEQYTVGPQGLQFFPTSSSPEWNLRALKWWQTWSRYCDINTRMSFGTFQSVAARTLFIDGEVFIVLAKGKDGKPRLQLVEGHRVSTPPGVRDSTYYISTQATTAAKGQGPQCVDGVEIDDNGRPVAYYVAEDNGSYNTNFRRIPADFMVHLFEPGRPNQYRGIPYIYPVMNDLHDLSDLQALEMQAAKQAAEVAYIVKTATGELNDEDLLRGNQVTENADGKDRKDYYHETFGAQVRVLKTGDEVDRFASDRPSVTTRDYWDYVLGRACAGVGIPKEIVMPASMQGTSMRSVLDIANSYFRARSAVQADHYLRIYEHVMGWAKDNDPALKGAPEDWFACATRPPESINVDIGNQSAALCNEYKLGMRTLQDVYARRGEDWRAALRQKAEEMAFAKQVAEEYGVERAELIQLTPNETATPPTSAAADGQPEQNQKQPPVSQ